MTLRLTIEGMSCAHCSARVLKALTDLPAVSGAKVSHQKGSAQVKGDALDEDTLRKAVEEAGYSVTAIQEKRGLFG